MGAQVNISFSFCQQVRDLCSANSLCFLIQHSNRLVDWTIEALPWTSLWSSFPPFWLLPLLLLLACLALSELNWIVSLKRNVNSHSLLVEFLPKDVSHSKSVIVSNLPDPEDFCPISDLEVNTFFDNHDRSNWIHTTLEFEIKSLTMYLSLSIIWIQAGNRDCDYSCTRGGGCQVRYVGARRGGQTLVNNFTILLSSLSYFGISMVFL